MKVGVYMPHDNKVHTESLSAMALGIIACGDDMVTVPLEEFDSKSLYDAAVVFGVRKAAVLISSQRGDVYDAYRSAHKNVLVLERGYVKRDQYYAAGWNGLNGRACFNNVNVSGDRWRDLGVVLKPYRTSSPTDPVVIIGQVPWDASVQHHDHISWLSVKVKELEIVTKREICVRPHPLAKQYTPLFFGTSRSEGDLGEVLESAHAIITYNSNVGVDALIAGVPVFCADEGSMVFDIAHHDIATIEKPSRPDREDWANRIAYAQWTTDEMREGLAWEHLREGPQ